ncbi:MAG: PVC-type heme-binding CxxCH protein, partial [Planctomycetota bacterium]
MFRLATLLIPWVLSSSCLATEPPISFKPEQHICIIGNALADRMQHHGWLETYLHASHPNHQLVFRNLGFTGDEVATRPRSMNFGSADEWLGKCEADTVFCFFGFNEALRGEAHLDTFRQDFNAMLDHMLAQKYNGHTAPQLVVFGPIAHEDLRQDFLPDGTANNRLLEKTNATMQQICEARGIAFVDLYAISDRLYRENDEPLTLNGIHLRSNGNRLLAREIVAQWLPDQPLPADASLESLRQAVLHKNDYWFNRYRVVDGYNVYGGRSTLAWHGQSNFDVMQREMEVFEVMTANRDRQVWAAAQGKSVEINDDNLPPLLAVKTNKEGPLEGGRFPYLGAEEAIDAMDVHADFDINVFASEEMFPRLINPAQISVDTDGRLWASVWPSYPHWNPTQTRQDALLILPDEDGDGVADECIVFADELNSVTGFEFWGGGVIVAAPPELWFLKDTDGDNRADVKLRILQGLSSADTHHSANAMLLGPDGWIYWSRGVFNVTNMETPTGTFRSKQSGVYRFHPRTYEVEFHFPIGPNPHGHVFDEWGFEFANDGTSGTGSYVNIGKGRKNKQWFKKRVRPVPATGFLSGSHFPPEMRGNFLICNVIGVLGVLQHEVRFEGADINAHEIAPLVLSSDPNFRPSDLEIGGDGALYIADWHNALIGHMQHNMRDPNRDATHGRIYRMTHKGRPLVKPVKLREASTAQLFEQFLKPEPALRYRTRIELSGRPTEKVVDAMTTFTQGLEAYDPSMVAQAKLECLWVCEEHQVAPPSHWMAELLSAPDPRQRAAAMRTLRTRPNESLIGELLQAAADPEALVRAEATKAGVELPPELATEVLFTMAQHPLDPELETVLAYAREEVGVDSWLATQLAAGKPLSPSARQFVLNFGSPELLT